MKERYLIAYGGPLCGAQLLIPPTQSNIKPKYAYASCAEIYTEDDTQDLQQLQAIYRICRNSARFVKLFNFRNERPRLYPMTYALAIDTDFLDEEDYEEYYKNIDDDDIPF